MPEHSAFGVVVGVPLGCTLVRARGGRTKRTALAVAAAASLCVAPGAPAGAANKGGGGRAIMNRFAQCTVQRRPEIARRLVLNPGVPPALSDLQELASAECLGRTGLDLDELRMRDSLYRGALAEQLIRRELSQAAVIDPGPLPVLEWPDPKRLTTLDEYGRKLNAAGQKQADLGYSEALADNAVMHLGECVVRADPAGSRAAILTEQDSPRELATLKAMSPTIARCIARGETPKFNRTTLRAALAVSYYRLGAMARAAKAGGAA